VGPADLLPDALVTRFTHGYAASVAPLSQAPAPILSAAVGFAERAERCGSRAGSRRISGTDELWHMLATRGVPVARDTGALHVHSGAFTTAAALIGEVDAITQATGLPPLKYAACMIAATRGDQAQALFDLSWRNATRARRGLGARPVLEADRVAP
jgi:hypothetical protein